MNEIEGVKAKIKNWASHLEQEARDQLIRLSSLPFIHSHVAVMPDAHAGKGSTVGTVIATKGAIIPAAVGVDIGCGMTAVKLPFAADALTDLSKLRSSIERSIPVGFNQHSEAKTDRDVTENLSSVTKSHVDRNKAACQCGTLGGGNHFIEICSDDKGGSWLMIHSGSRNLGKRVAEVHIDKARGLMKSYFIELPDPDLSYLAQGTSEFKDYINDLQVAQAYAKQNRDVMVKLALKDISFHIYGENIGEEKMTILRVDCHHNYTQIEHHFGKDVWVTRKGAVSARKGQLGIIPGSMGDKSYIVEGLGNPQSFNSCSHGAGRKMSRTKARAVFTIEDLTNQTKGIECRKDADIIDEIPSAYKSIDNVMNDQKDLVVPLYELKQLICIKG